MAEHRTTNGNHENNAINELDKKIICALQGDFPLVAEPYKVLAEKAGVSEELFLERVKAMEEEKKIRKMGAVLRPHDRARLALQPLHDGPRPQPRGVRAHRRRPRRQDRRRRARHALHQTRVEKSFHEVFSGILIPVLSISHTSHTERRCRKFVRHLFF